VGEDMLDEATGGDISVKLVGKVVELAAGHAQYGACRCLLPHAGI
jgi:hypothetical protein